MDCKVHEVTKSWAQLSDFHFHIMSQMLSNAFYASEQPFDIDALISILQMRKLRLLDVWIIFL